MNVGRKCILSKEASFLNKIHDVKGVVLDFYLSMQKKSLTYTSSAQLKKLDINFKGVTYILDSEYFFLSVDNDTSVDGFIKYLLTSIFPLLLAFPCQKRRKIPKKD